MTVTHFIMPLVIVSFVAAILLHLQNKKLEKNNQMLRRELLDAIANSHEPEDDNTESTPFATITKKDGSTRTIYTFADGSVDMNKNFPAVHG